MRWTVHEQLLLIQAVQLYGENNWSAVSKAMRPHLDTSKRPSDWFAPKKCLAQFTELIETYGAPKRKRNETSSSANPASSNAAGTSSAAAGTTTGGASSSGAAMSVWPSAPSLSTSAAAAAASSSSSQPNSESPIHAIEKKLFAERIEELRRGVTYDLNNCRKIKTDLQRIEDGELDAQLPHVIADLKSKLASALGDAFDESLFALPQDSHSGDGHSQQVPMDESHASAAATASAGPTPMDTAETRSGSSAAQSTKHASTASRKGGPLSLKIDTSMAGFHQSSGSSPSGFSATSAHSDAESEASAHAELHRRLQTHERSETPSPLPQVSASWKKSLMIVWRNIANHRYANVFLRPVSDSEVPGYSKVVKRPMDLTTIKKRIEDGTIRSSKEFLRDLYLMFQNALMYNEEDHDVYLMAFEMRNDARQQVLDFMSTESEELASTVSSLSGVSTPTGTSTRRGRTVAANSEQ